MTNNIFFDLKDLRYCGKNVIIGKTVRIRRPDLVSIGDGTIIDDFIYISGEVKIGKYVHIASSCSLQASKSKIIIKDFAGLSSGVKVFAASAEYVSCSFDYAPIPKELMYGGIFKEVTIGEFVQIGANSVVLPGTQLPIGFTCGALSKLTNRFKYKSWSVLSNDKNGSCIRRTGINKILNQARKLTGRGYSNEKI